MGRGLPLPENLFHFMSGNGVFLCFLGICFNVSIRRVKQSRIEVLCAHWSVISHGGHIISYTSTHIRAVRHVQLTLWTYTYIPPPSISICYFDVFYFKRFNSISHSMKNNRNGAPVRLEPWLRVVPGSCRIGPAPFPGLRSYTATKPGFSLLCLFCVVVFLCAG